MSTRCGWSESNPQMIAYHDTEWGVPVHDDRQLFGKLVLDGFQAGLSWAIILRKRDAFLNAFDGFNPEKMARYDARRVAKILRDPGIVRNRQKVRSAIGNARSLYFALSKYCPDRGSTLTVSPGEINSGTCTVTPLDNFAGLVLAVFVAVFITGEVSITFSSITDGSSMAMGRPSNHSTCTTISGCNQGVSTPTARSSSVNCSYVC